jgi:flagellar protein FlaG
MSVSVSSSVGATAPAATAAAMPRPTAAAVPPPPVIAPATTPVAVAERGVEFHVDSGTGLTVISVVDRATGEVVRQIPEDVVIRIARYLDAELGGHGVIDTSA